MSKLFKLKEWLTLEEAARHLSILFAEAVTVADVLRLGLDRHLTLSVDFVNHAQAELGRVLPFKDVPKMKMPPMRRDGTPGLEEWTFPDGVCIEKVDKVTDDTLFVHFEKETMTIDGIWDIEMLGAERIDIENRFQSLTSGPAVQLINMDGTFVSRANGTWASLQDQFEDEIVEDSAGKESRIKGSYYPANGLPKDSALIVRTDALRSFEKKAMGADSVQEAPYFDADAADYPELLHIAVRAWEHAR